MGFGQKASAEGCEIDFSLTDQFVGADSIIEEPARGSWKSRFFEDSRGDIHEHIGPPGDICVGGIKAHGDIDRIESIGFHVFQEIDRFAQHLVVVAVEIDHTESCRKGAILWPDAASRIESF